MAGVGGVHGRHGGIPLVGCALVPKSPSPSYSRVDDKIDQRLLAFALRQTVLQHLRRGG